jgi:ferritin-like metal-binding protein YciE
VAKGIGEQLTDYLSDVHSLEEQALVQLRRAPRLAGDPDLQEIFARHLVETEQHEQLVRGRLEVRGGKPHVLKEAVMRAGGVGFLLFARLQPDTPGKLVAHAFSYEHLELAAYDLLTRVAERADDVETAEIARTIREEERVMALRLSGSFDRAAEAALRELAPDDLGEQLTKYLADAHAIEAQAIQLLERGPKIAGESLLASVFEEHLEQTRRHQELIEQRLDALGGSPSWLKDAAMRLGALNWALFFQAQPDTPAKLAAFAFAFEHLEIAAYEQLKHVAAKVNDDATIAAADRILAEEHEAAEHISSTFDDALSVSLGMQGVRA